MDKEDKLFEKALSYVLIGLGVLLIAMVVWITISFAIYIPLSIKDTEATIKVKERLAEDGIVITETQIQKILGDE